MIKFCQILLFIFQINSLTAQNKSAANNAAGSKRIIPGAERLSVYVPLLKGKRIAVFANQTSMVGNTHLVDTLKKLGVNIKLIFGPEHGFRGIADAGEKVSNTIDEKTGIPIVSMYGSKRRPSAEDLEDIDFGEIHNNLVDIYAGS